MSKRAWVSDRLKAASYECLQVKSLTSLCGSQAQALVDLCLGLVWLWEYNLLCASSHPRNHRNKQSKCVPAKVRTWAYLLFCTLPHPQNNILVIFKRHCLQDTGLIKLQQRRWGRHHTVFWAASAARLCVWAARPCFLLLPTPALFLAALLPRWLPSSLANLLEWGLHWWWDQCLVEKHVFVPEGLEEYWQVFI